MTPIAWWWTSRGHVPIYPLPPGLVAAVRAQLPAARQARNDRNDRNDRPEEAR